MAIKKPVAMSAVKKKKLRSFKAPEDFKGFFLDILIRTAKDGIVQKVEGVRYSGRPDTAKVKTVLLSETAPDVLQALTARLAARLFATNPMKRPPGNASFKIHGRVRASSEGVLGFSVKVIQMKDADGKKKTLSKTNEVYRKIRGVSMFIPGAFVTLEPFPKPTKAAKGKKQQDDEEDDE